MKERSRVHFSYCDPAIRHNRAPMFTSLSIEHSPARNGLSKVIEECFETVRLVYDCTDEEPNIKSITEAPILFVRHLFASGLTEIEHKHIFDEETERYVYIIYEENGHIYYRFYYGKDVESVTDEEIDALDDEGTIRGKLISQH